MKKILIINIIWIMLFFLLSLPNISKGEGELSTYSIDIEWGSFSFVYDKGSWDTNKLEYVAEESSLFPANGTTEGKPGWYGFNGEANKITIYNSSENSAITANVSVAKEIKDTEGNTMENQPTYNSNLQYSIYKDNDWNCFEGYEEGSNTSITKTIAPQESLSYFISISGELNTEEGTFSLPKNIGSVTIKVDKE